MPRLMTNFYELIFNAEDTFRSIVGSNKETHVCPLPILMSF